MLALAVLWGVNVSSPVYNDTKGKIFLACAFTGEFRVKYLPQTPKVMLCLSFSTKGRVAQGK